MKLASLFNETKRGQFVVIDSVFPQKEPLAFRNAEINEYFKKIKNFECYTMYPMQPEREAWFDHGYGVTHEEFIDNKKGYLRYYPENSSKIHYLVPDTKYNLGLAYSYFLAETYVLLPFYEKNKIPFVFVLYPGGSFGLNLKESDEMLKRIFRSKYFRCVIVTQQITLDYLLSRELCASDRIEYIYGGFVQYKKEDVLGKKHYKIDKPTFDICFVAAKYSPKGVDKGYDLFIEAANKIAESARDVYFHVVGGFDENEIDISKIKSKIKFYGYQKPDFLLDFYSKMDIFLAPNRPYALYSGNFDGFPLGIDASYCGTAIFVADELGMNHYYVDNKEIVIIPLNVKGIVDKVLWHYNNIDDLYDLSLKGQKVTQKLFDIDYQINERIKLFGKYESIEIIT